MQLPAEKYRQVREECLSEIIRKSKIRERHAGSDEERQNIRNLQACAIRFLDKYAKLRAGAMTDREIDEFYRESVEALERVLRAKKQQYDIVREQIDELRAELLRREAKVCNIDSGEYDKEECERVREQRRDLEYLEGMFDIAREEDLFLIDARLIACQVARSIDQKKQCIESLADLVEVRRDVLPLMCGLPPSEFVGRVVPGKGIEPPKGRIAKIAGEVAEDFEDAMVCIENFLSSGR